MIKEDNAQAVFPSYARIMLSGFSLERESGLIRTEMDSGPPRQAKIKSVVMMVRTVDIYLPTYQNFVDFDKWYSETLQEGSLPFTFKDPLTGNNVTNARFRDGGYTATLLGGKDSGWKMSMKIEVWANSWK